MATSCPSYVSTYSLSLVENIGVRWDVVLGLGAPALQCLLPSQLPSWAGLFQMGPHPSSSQSFSRCYILHSSNPSPLGFLSSYQSLTTRFLLPLVSCSPSNNKELLSVRYSYSFLSATHCLCTPISSPSQRQNSCFSPCLPHPIEKGPSSLFLTPASTA